jgi:hypothetical protein
MLSDSDLVSPISLISQLHSCKRDTVSIKGARVVDSVIYTELRGRLVQPDVALDRTFGTELDEGHAIAQPFSRNGFMISLARGDNKPTFVMVVAAIGIWAFSGFAAVSYGRGHEDVEPVVHHGHHESGLGTLGYGGSWLYPGYQGFGLSFHRGYGYGGDALGVGAFGGYPIYGGPGYPHPLPQHWRQCGIEPIFYYGGPSDPSQRYPLFFERVGPLFADVDVVSVSDRNAQGYTSDFGPFTGTLPYPETLFAPYAAAAAATGSSTSPPPAAGSSVISPEAPRGAGLPSRGPYLGIDEEPVTDALGARGMKVTRIYPRSAAQETGLHVGDVILSINGYLTTERGNLAWIIANHASNRVLSLNVRTITDGKVHTITTHLPLAAVDTTRPSSLPLVSDGPPPATR